MDVRFIALAPAEVEPALSPVGPGGAPAPAGWALPPRESGVPTSNGWVPDGAEQPGPTGSQPATRAVVTEHGVDELPDLLRRDDGLVWVDIPTWDDEAERVADARSSASIRWPSGTARSATRCPRCTCTPSTCSWCCTPRSPGRPGTCTTSSSTSSSARNFLVTVHGPLNPAVDPRRPRSRCTSLLHRLRGGQAAPDGSPTSCRTALVSALTGRLRNYTAVLTQDVWQLEQRVTAGHLGDPEQFLEEMFRARHGLLTVETMAALSREVYARMAKIEAFGPGRGRSARGHRRPVRPAAGDGARAEGLPAGHHRVLPGPDEHQDDHRRRAAGGDRRGHPADHRPVVDPRDERHRQRRDPLRAAGGRPGCHARRCRSPC